MSERPTPEQMEAHWTAKRDACNRAERLVRPARAPLAVAAVILCGCSIWCFMDGQPSQGAGALVAAGAAWLGFAFAGRARAALRAAAFDAQQGIAAATILAFERDERRRAARGE